MSTSDFDMIYVPGEIPTTIPSNVTTPPHSQKVRFVLKRFEVKIRLPKISPKSINLAPTDTEFYMDTFKHTKKYMLRFPYPQNIKVNSQNVEATMEGEFLVVHLPIVEILDKMTGKKLRKKENAGSATQPQAKKPALKRKASSGPATAAEQPKPKKQKQEGTVGQKKNTQQLELIEQINKEQDEKRKERLEKEAQKYLFFDTKKKERTERREVKAAIRKKALEKKKELLSEKKGAKKDKKKK
uniref:SHSP domain-containing protein n=1 Tax=Arcella intermedia TaxID=1963864 RepID=A0A6B2LEG5_9EUKA